jgi:hypothetical protein
MSGNPVPNNANEAWNDLMAQQQAIMGLPNMNFVNFPNANNIAAHELVSVHQLNQINAIAFNFTNDIDINTHAAMKKLVGEYNNLLVMKHINGPTSPVLMLHQLEIMKAYLIANEPNGIAFGMDDMEDELVSVVSDESQSESDNESDASNESIMIEINGVFVKVAGGAESEATTVAW